MLSTLNRLNDVEKLLLMESNYSLPSARRPELVLKGGNIFGGVSNREVQQMFGYKPSQVPNQRSDMHPTTELSQLVQASLLKYDAEMQMITPHPDFMAPQEIPAGSNPAIQQMGQPLVVSYTKEIESDAPSSVSLKPTVEDVYEQVDDDFKEEKKAEQKKEESEDEKLMNQIVKQIEADKQEEEPEPEQMLKDEKEDDMEEDDLPVDDAEELVLEASEEPFEFTAEEEDEIFGSGMPVDPVKRALKIYANLKDDVAKYNFVMQLLFTSINKYIL